MSRYDYWYGYGGYHEDDCRYDYGYYSDVYDSYLDDYYDYYQDLYDDDTDEFDDYSDYEHEPDDWVQDYDYEEEEDDAVNQLVSQMQSFIVGKEYQRYGYFECKKCSNTWQSANTYCIYKGKKNGEKVFKVFKVFRMVVQSCC